LAYELAEQEVEVDVEGTESFGEVKGERRREGKGKGTGERKWQLEGE